MPEHSPLFIQIKDMELGILGSHEVPFEEIPYSPHRDRKTLFSFVFKPTIASDKLADVTVINSEKQCELLFNARVTRRSLQLPHFHKAENSRAVRPRTRRWTVHNCTMQEVDFLDNVQQWRELPLAKRMRVGSVFYAEHKRFNLHSCLRFRNEEDEDVMDSREFILPTSPYSQKYSSVLNNSLRVKIAPDLQTRFDALRMRLSFTNLLTEERSADWKSLSNLLSDFEQNIDIVSLLRATQSSRPYLSTTTPLVYGIQPKRIPINTVTTVKIVGKNFGELQADLKHVFIGGADCVDTVTSWTADVIICSVQCDVVGRGVVTVCTRTGGVGLCADVLEFFEAYSPVHQGNIYTLLKTMENVKAFEEEMTARNAGLASLISRTANAVGEWKMYLRKLHNLKAVNNFNTRA